uniref:Uncharacterized protein n=1 Tax=Eutreptiella gymnastica TaxID=73025 RepID=A0A7S1IER5_9EUGL
MHFLVICLLAAFVERAGDQCDASENDLQPGCLSQWECPQRCVPLPRCLPRIPKLDALLLSKLDDLRERTADMFMSEAYQTYSDEDSGREDASGESDDEAVPVGRDPSRRRFRKGAGVRFLQPSSGEWVPGQVAVSFPNGSCDVNTWPTQTTGGIVSRVPDAKSITVHVPPN